MKHIILLAALTLTACATKEPTHAHCATDRLLYCGGGSNRGASVGGDTSSSVGQPGKPSTGNPGPGVNVGKPTEGHGKPKGPKGPKGKPGHGHGHGDKNHHHSGPPGKGGHGKGKGHK